MNEFDKMIDVDNDGNYDESHLNKDNIINQLIAIIDTLIKTVETEKEHINKLYSNYNVKKGWHLDINKEKINYQIKIDKDIGITAEKREKEIIVSLTSYPDRMYDIHYTLYSLLHQTLKPDRVILWLAKEQFPNMESDIADSILDLKRLGLSIMWCEDIKSYKKLIPALEQFPNDIIITADDDIYYPENWLELLYNSYLKNPEAIHCNRAHAVEIHENGFLPYEKWNKCIKTSDASYKVFPTGCGGVLYPPKSLHMDVLNKEKFMSLSPTADDVWFWAMGVLNHTKFQVVENGMHNIRYVNYAREIGLCNENTLSHVNTGNATGNDTCIMRVVQAYPELLGNVKKDEGKNFVRRTNEFVDSAKYWENRYVKGGTSGAGSYNHLASFKAKIINEFVESNNIQKVIEWGCGDGNQLSLARYPEYVGYDVSQEAIRRCAEMFSQDSTKRFVWSGANDFVSLEKADLSLSLDVLYHLVEDSVYELYMQRLFESSDKYVCIYSCNFEKEHAAHVRCRKFTDYVEAEFKEWRLVDFIPNEYPYNESEPDGTSWSDFYIYEKIN